MKTRAAIAARLSVGIVDCVAAKLGSAIYAAARGAFAENSYTMNDDQRANLEALRQDAVSRQQQCDHSDVMAKTVAAINEAARFTPVVR